MLSRDNLSRSKYFRDAETGEGNLQSATYHKKRNSITFSKITTDVS